MKGTIWTNLKYPKYSLHVLNLMQSETQLHKTVKAKHRIII
jgi:hypothetical protein